MNFASDAVGILGSFFFFEREREEGTEKFLGATTEMENHIPKYAQKHAKETGIVDFS